MRNLKQQKAEKPKRRRVVKQIQPSYGRPVAAEKPQTIEEPTAEISKVEPIVTERPKPNPRPRKPLVKKDASS